MTTRAQIVAEAREWIDTPFGHQQRTKGVSTDCGGLVGGVATALGVVPTNWWRDVFDPVFGGYGRQPSNGTLESVCDSFMQRIPIDDAGPGDVVLMRFRGEPQHLAILAPYVHGGLAVVHAMLSARKVSEHRLDEAWRACIVAAFRMPGVA